MAPTRGATRASPDWKPRVCFVGPMVGRNKGFVVTQGEILSELFAEVGYSVISVSNKANRYLRLLDIMQTLVARRGEYDVQCLQVFTGLSFVVEDIASAIGKSLGKPVAMVLRGGAMPQFVQRYPRWTRRVLNRADVIVVPSRYLGEAMAHFGYSTRLIPNVIDVSRYPYKRRRILKPRLFWMRAFHPIYNPEMAVRVLCGLRARGIDASLVIAGQDKGLEGDMKRLVHDLGAEGFVRFPGFLDMEAKLREARTSDIYVNTNRIDNMPVSIVEACAAGLPVVATGVGGIPYLLEHEKTGLLVADEDVEGMVRAVVRLLDEPDLAERLSVNGRELALESSWERIRPQWEVLFAELTG